MLVNYKAGVSGVLSAGTCVIVSCGGGLPCGRTSSVLRRPVVKIKSNSPRYSATKIEIIITRIVYTIVCKRVGQATYRNSPFVSLMYCMKPIV